jgi:heterodisulfide reductase subunit B
MNLPYYPGCTLKANAANFEDSAFKALEKLDVHLQEMQDWVCCGTVFSQTSDDLMSQLSSVRNLLRAEEQNIKELVVLCSMCYNTLLRSKDFILEDEENLKKVNDFMYKENLSYSGKIEILHLLSVLKDRIKFAKVKESVTNPLNGLKIGAYYGCLLVRPEKYAIDDFEAPVIIEDLMSSLGAEAVDFSYKLECCGAYQTITKKEISVKRVYEILESATRRGCDAIVTGCPLCAYNLDFLQKDIKKEYSGFKSIPVFYFTELMAVALGCEWDNKWSEKHFVNPEDLLKKKNLI